MCTNGSADVLILCTNYGSIFLHDLKNIESNPNISNQFNYQAILEFKIPNFNEMEEEKKQQKIQRAMIKYPI